MLAPPRFPLLRAALPLAIELCACLVVLELGVRAVLAAGGRPWSPEAARADLARRVDLAAGEVAPAPPGLLHPFVAWEPEPDPGGVHAYFRSGPPPGEVSVLVLGGSLADELAVRRRESIERALSADARLAGRGVRLLDGADPGHKAPQPLLRAAFLTTSGFRPTAVVLLDGPEELALAAENAAAGVHPVMPPAGAWQPLAERYGIIDARELAPSLELLSARARVRSELRWMASSPALLSSALLGRSALVRAELSAAALERREREFEAVATGFREQRARSPEMRGPPWGGGERGALESAVGAWVESSWSLRDLCATRGISYVHLLAPEPPHEAAAPEPARRALAQGYPLLRAAGARLAERGVALEDLSGLHAEKGGAHAGEEERLDLLAGRLVRALLPRLGGG